MFALPSFISRPRSPQVCVETGWMCFGSIATGLCFSISAADAKEKQFWVTQLRACAKYHMETNSKVSNCRNGGSWGQVAPARMAPLQPRIGFFGELFSILSLKFTTIRNSYLSCDIYIESRETSGRICL